MKFKRIPIAIIMLVFMIPACGTPTPPPGVSIWGTVSDSSGHVSGAKVRAELAGLETVTDNKGRYFFSNLPEGEEFITVEAAYHVSSFQSVIVKGEQAANVDFSLSQAVPEQCVLGTIAGKVVFSDGQPAAKATIRVRNEWNETSVTTTDTSGLYKIDDTCGGLILAEWEGMRGGIELYVYGSASADETITAPDIIIRK